MATISVREIARTCLGVTGIFSVTGHVYGYLFRDTDSSVFGSLGSGDTLPATGTPTTRSLRRHLETISGRATDLAVILVGHEDDFSWRVSRDDVTKVQYALQVTRDIYAQANLGVRRASWQRIGLSDAGWYVDISGRDEAQDLTPILLALR